MGTRYEWVVAVKQFVVTAERTSKWWVLQAVEAPGAISQVSRLDQVNEIREAIAFVQQIPESEVDVVVRPIIPQAALPHLDQLEALRSLAAAAGVAVAREAHETAKSLSDAGLTVRDIGTIMHLSHQRAHQLLTAVDAPDEGAGLEQLVDDFAARRRAS